MFRSNSRGSLNTGDSDSLSTRLSYTEVFLEKCQANFVKIAEKEASLRNINDELVEDIIEFTRHERINLSLRTNLEEFAKQLSIIQDYRDSFVKRIQNQLIQPFEEYHEIFKQKKDVLQKSQLKHRKNIEEKEKLEKKNNRNPTGAQGMATAQNNVQYALRESQHSQIILHDEFVQFERIRINDIKKHLTNFVLIQLAFHSRALEYCTNAHRNLLKINEEKDLHDFREYFFLPLNKSSSASNSVPRSKSLSEQQEKQEEYANPPSKRKDKNEDQSEPGDAYASINDNDRLPPMSNKSQSMTNISRDSSSSSLYAKPAKPPRSTTNTKPTPIPLKLNVPSPKTSSSSSSSSTTSDSDD